MNLEDRISNSINTKQQYQFNLFEYHLNRALSIKESLDSFLKIIETPSYNSINKIKEYLSHSDQNELDDWVNALDIAVSDRNEINRWTMALAHMSKDLPLAAKTKPILMGILELLGAPV
jgi:hypothetical protein